jgi:hypothetical protein
VLLLVATSRGQHLDSDVFEAVEGELVRPAWCDDVTCGCCDHLFAGITSEGVTSTARIADIPMTRKQLHLVVRGYAEPLLHVHDRAGTRRLANDLLWPGRRGWPIGTVLERHGDELRVRA